MKRGRVCAGGPGALLPVLVVPPLLLVLLQPSEDKPPSVPLHRRGEGQEASDVSQLGFSRHHPPSLLTVRMGKNPFFFPLHLRAERIRYRDV